MNRWGKLHKENKKRSSFSFLILPNDLTPKLNPIILKYKIWAVSWYLAASSLSGFKMWMDFVLCSFFIFWKSECILKYLINRWKYEGPSDSFKALVDMAAVHSSCRLCIHLATINRDKEEKSPSFKKRPCKCTRGSETVYHIYVRERGRFEMESIYLRYTI